MFVWFWCLVDLMFWFRIVVDCGLLLFWLFVGLCLSAVVLGLLLLLLLWVFNFGVG